MFATESKESSEEDYLLLRRLLRLLLLLLRLLRFRTSLLLLMLLLLLLRLLMHVRGSVGRGASDAKRAIRQMRVIPATNSVMVAVAEFRRRVSGSGDDCWAATSPGVSIRTIVTRGATASIEMYDYRFVD